MSHAVVPSPDAWTAVDLVARFGAIPLCRVRHDPPPGSASEEHVVRLHDRENRLYELIDGVLVEKTVGTYESYLAMLLGRLLGNHVSENDLGVILGADGMLRLAPGLVRIPDLSFISWQRLPNGQIPREAIVDLAPDLAVEIISKGNTLEEMDRKRCEYFDAGVEQVWYVYPASRQVKVYSSVQQHVALGEQDTLEGRGALAHFRLRLSEFFAPPRRPE